MSFFSESIKTVCGFQDERKSIWNIKEIRFPLISIFLSLFFPPMGCITFLAMSRVQKSSPKYKVSVIALYVGSFLSVVYTFLIAMFLLKITGPKRMPYVQIASKY